MRLHFTGVGQRRDDAQHRTVCVCARTCLQEAGMTCDVTLKVNRAALRSMLL